MSRLAHLSVLISIILALPVSAKQRLTFGINEGAVVGQIAREMAPVVAHLNTSPSIKVELKVFPSNDALYDALRDRKVDLNDHVIRTAVLASAVFLRRASERGAQRVSCRIPFLGVAHSSGV